MRIRFFLKDSTATTPTALYALVSYEGNKVKHYIGESVLPKFWNQKTNTCRTSPKFPEGPEFNERLLQIRGAIAKTFLAYKNAHEGQSPTPAKLKALLEKSLKHGSANVDFLSFFETFARNTIRGIRIDPRTKKSVKGTGGKGYLTTLQHLRAFNEVWKENVAFETIGLEFYGDFTTYLSAPPRSLSLNTIGSHIQRIKAVMSEAVDNKLTANVDFKSKRFVKVSEDADTIYLNLVELKEMESLDLTDRPSLDAVRDLFLIGCNTGLRFSDFSILSRDNIRDGFIRITQTKTGDPVIIPVHKTVERILNKYSGSLPRVLSNEKMNVYLKQIGEQLKCLEKIETKEITKGGVKLVRSVPKWKLLTTHTARRSFATNEYLAGVPTITLMAITGHKTEKSFLKYIRVTPEEHAVKLKDLWDLRDQSENMLKAV